MSASMSLAPAAPAASSDSVGFFRFHGFWAPGVRLFSRVPFVGKAVIISVVFLLVVAQSTALVVLHAQDTGRSAERQLVGVQIERGRRPD